jgi:hypothetical protein
MIDYGSKLLTVIIFNIFILYDVKSAYAITETNVGLDFTYNYSSQWVLSPLFGIKANRTTFYGGPSFQLAFIPGRYSQIGFKLGIEHDFPLHNKKYIIISSLNYEYLKYYYNTTIYDTAVPNIPVAARIVHTAEYSAIPFYLGVKYKLTNKFSITPKLGIAYVWKFNTDPDNYHRYLMEHTYTENIHGFDFMWLINLNFKL